MLRPHALQQAPRLSRRAAATPSYARLLSSTSRSTASSSAESSFRIVFPFGTTAAAGLALLAVGGGAYVLHAQGMGGKIEMEGEQGKKGWSTEGGVGHYFHFKPHVFLWGRNSHGVTSPSSADSTTNATTKAPSQTIKRPSIAASLSDLILRDLALSATYGVAVDANGDVLQWGSGFSPQGHVERTLTGRDIVKVAATQEGKIFGLSKRGEVFVWAADKANQDVKARRAIEGFEWPRGGAGEGAGWMMLLGKGILWGRGGAGGGNVETVRLGTDVQLERGEKFTSLSAGASHLLALTNKGRSFAVPLCLSANEHGQLGVRSVTLLAPPHPGSSPTSGLSIRLEPDERLNEMGWEKVPPPPKRLDPLLLPAVSPPTTSEPTPHMDHIPSLPTPASTSTLPDDTSLIRLHPDPAHHAALERSIHFCTTLHEIPALRGVEVVELVAGKKHSLARLGGRMHGRVLGWGSNSYGQLGLGSTLSYPTIPAPTEVPFRRSPAYQGASRPNTLECTRIAAGGNVSYFVVEADDGKSVDLLASGQGQFGGLGNGLWAHATSPVRVKTVSGLREWNETTKKVESVGIKDVQAGDGHVAVVLDNAVKNPDGSIFGRDVFVWGYNEHYQLGTGKRSNLPTPQHLAPLPYPRLVESPQATLSTGGAAAVVSKQEETISSGTTSPMPHKRMQLSPAVPSNVTKLPRGAVVEEAICAGDGGTGVYWRIVNP
ncbi:hypothetical protein JCM10908_004416 [Rhodotorula pacifica]|uniref:uncharacterized protein n=1 Tax=Rhodotorula pacifica TaxID=1495444 RepID=UPI00317C7372